MKYTITKQPKSEVEIRVEITADEMEKEWERALDEAAKNAEINGFRKGRAPRDIVKEKIGDGELSKKAILQAVQHSYLDIIKKLQENNGESFEPIGSPKIRVSKYVKGEGMEYIAGLSVLPLFDLPDYKKITRQVLTEKQPLSVSEKEVDESLLWLRKSRAQEVTVKRPAKHGDRVEIDFEAKMDGGVLLNGGKSQNHPLIIGEGRMLAGFEEAIIGMQEGEDKSFSLSVPDDYVESSLRKKTLAFRVTMKLVQERIVPEATDEFARGVGSFQNIEDLKSSIKNGLLAEKEEKGREQLRIKILDAIADSTSAEIPEMLVGRELEKMTEELRAGVQRMGLSWSDYLASIGKNEDGLKQNWKKNAERRVKIALILRRIAKIEGIQPTETEVQEAANHNFARIGTNDDEFGKIDRESFLEYNTAAARNEKVLKFLENQSV